MKDWPPQSHKDKEKNPVSRHFFFGGSSAEAYPTPGVLPARVRKALKRRWLAFFSDPRVRKCLKRNGLVGREPSVVSHH